MFLDIVKCDLISDGNISQKKLFQYELHNQSAFSLKINDDVLSTNPV